MKKTFLLLILFPAAVFAGGTVALVYDNEAAVRAGRPMPSAVTAEGIFVSAKWVLANNATMHVGIPGEPLKKGVLVKLDAPSDLALIQSGEVIADPDLQKAYEEKAKSFLAFSPAVLSTGLGAALPVAAPVVSTAPYKILINNQEAGQTPIVSKVRLRKSELNFEFVRLSTEPVWTFDLQLTSDPKLSFWKKGKNQSLNEVPVSDFRYSQQVFFKPLKDGRSIKVPVEAYFMEKGSYTLKVVLTSKVERYEMNIPIIFKEKV